MFYFCSMKSNKNISNRQSIFFTFLLMHFIIYCYLQGAKTHNILIFNILTKSTTLLFFYFILLFSLITLCYFPDIFVYYKCYTNVKHRNNLLRVHINFNAHFRVIFSLFQKYSDGVRHHIFHFK